jgi:hypothetical protein
MYIWGCDVGTSNTAITRMSLDGEISPYFTKFDSNLDPLVIHQTLLEFIKDLSPNGEDIVCIVFYRFNVKTLIRLTRVAHSLYVGFGEYTEDITYVDNNTWRSTLFGTSKIKKEECQEQAYLWFPELLEYPKTKRGHMSDSTCIAEHGRRRYMSQD